MHEPFPVVSDREVLAHRGKRSPSDPRRPYAYFVERERNARGDVAEVATVFLTSCECSFRCLMCDLWTKTLDTAVEVGDVPTQIRWALDQMDVRSVSAIKLYNNGNFFDPRAVPEADYGAIADLVRGFDTVVVENHPRLCTDRCFRFRDLISPAKLQIAMGLETCHPEVLRSLNKRMTLNDFDVATKKMHQGGISTRTFLLLGAPFLVGDTAIDWCLRSVSYALSRGVECCCIIPTRDGNGIMDQLSKQGRFVPPSGAALEQVLEQGIDIANRAGLSQRVFADLWDAERFFACSQCRVARIRRLREMNLTQETLPVVRCDSCESAE